MTLEFLFYLINIMFYKLTISNFDRFMYEHVMAQRDTFTSTKIH